MTKIEVDMCIGRFFTRAADAMDFEKLDDTVVGC